MASIQAAIVSFKLDHLEEWTERRQAIARKYTSVFDEISSISVPRELPKSKHVFHKYAMTAGSKRDRLKKHLKQAGIGTMVHYTPALNQEPLFSEYVESNIAFPTAERLSREELSLPIYPELQDSEINYVCEQVMNFDWH